jgi:Zn-dependent protease
LGRGYLTLDIRKYTDMLMSVVLPVVFLLLGGIPLPGGAVWINHGNIPSRHRQALVSAAGPAMNILFGIACLLAVKSGVFDDALALRWTLTYLGWLEFLTAAINLLPVPGLDGFGIIRPYLPHHIQVAAMQMSTYAILILFMVLWYNQGALGFLFNLSDSGVTAFGIDPIQVAIGHEITDIRQITGGA